MRTLATTIYRRLKSSPSRRGSNICFPGSFDMGNHIFLDFDGTITAKDTITNLAQFALDAQNARGTNLSEPWSAVVKAYLEGYKACVENHHTPEHKRTCVEQEVDFLRQMKSSEMESLSRVGDCAIFKNISTDNFRDAGRRLVEEGKIVLRPGFHDYVHRKTNEGSKVWVLSVNWSAAFIEGACYPSKVHVISNSINAEGIIVGPQLLGRDDNNQQRTLSNSVDKLDAMKAALGREYDDSLTTSVYMGDSITDMECIIAADNAIVISDGPKSTLLDTLRRVGKNVEHAVNGDAAGSICWASNFDEITASRRS